MPTVLSISNPNHNSGAALIQDGKIVGAIDEAKLSRLKRDSRFPAASLNYLLEKVDSKKVDRIALAGVDAPYDKRRYKLRRSRTDDLLDTVDITLRYLYNRIARDRQIESEVELRDHIQRGVLDLPDGLPSTYVDHHRAHAASTYYTSGFSEATVLTVDGGGDKLSSTVYVGEDGELNRLAKNSSVDSVGRIWSRMPSVFGFKGGRHAGKFMGLAAYAETPPDALRERMASMLEVDGMDIRNNFFRSYEYLSDEKQLAELKDEFGSFSAAEVALALQQRTETVLTEFGRTAVRETGITDVAIAGGVFANVKVNQRLYELDEIDSLYVHPDMRDSGLALGVALDVYDRNYGYESTFMPDVYHGPEYGDAEIERAVNRHEMREQYDISTYDSIDVVADTVADLLVDGQVVNLYTGRMEYGPRALGNRSTLYQPTDPTAIRWLNEKLDRTEFMPFAPVTLKEYASECYEEYKPETCPAADFMTISLDCTETMAERSPGVVHVDGTARPQIIEREINPLYYEILASYHDKTGIPSLINTSFNMHGEPIVCTPAQAINSFEASNTDALVMNTTVVTRG